MTDRALFVVNGAVERRREHLEARCRRLAPRFGFQPDFVASLPERGDWDEGVGRLSSLLVELDANLVVAVGGDGTVGACAQAAAPIGIPLAVLPRGAANLVAHAMALPFGLDAALEAAFTGAEHLVDLGVANGRTFVAMAGLGLDAAVVAGTSVPLKRHLKWIGYALVGISRLHARPCELTIRLDGASPIVRRARAVVVGNLGLLPGGFSLLPAARIDDGVLDVGLLCPEGPLGWIELAAHLLAERVHGSGPLAGDGLVEHHLARRVEIRAEREVACEADGEVLASCSVLSVEVRPGALKLRVPARRPHRSRLA